MSIAGGLHHALLAAQAHQCSTVQLFTKNANQWNAPPLTPDAIRLFRRTLRQTKLRYPMAHDSYLINLGSPEPVVLQKSLDAFADEIERCERLGIPFLVFHPGSHVGSGEAAGLQRIADSLNAVLGQKPKCKTQVLLENTAGQGSNLGSRFEQLAEILAKTENPNRLGVCLDTCHLFAAGYDLRTRPAYETTFHEFDAIVGLERVKVFHLNDSKKGLGSRVDRHENIGKGELGLEPFRFLLNDPRFAGLPMLLETPGGDEAYRIDLTTLRSLKQ
jgi:deoxyribonuclease-4